MVWNPVPSTVQLEGAAHSPEVTRNALYASTGGAEGVNGPTDCKVTATTVPGGTVNVAIGSVLILARQANVRQQSYADANPTVDNVAVTSTGSTKRSDLVVVRVEDPGQAGEPWDDPANPAVGPYIYTRVIPNVPAGTTRLQDVAGHENDTAVTLARIDLPANTATVTNAMIVDLRKIARPREATVRLTDLGATPGTMTSAASGTQFPPFQPSVVVPDWATHMQVDMSVSQISAGASSNGFANVSVRAADGTTIVVDGDQMAYNVDVASGVNTRFVHLASTPVGDVRSQRGKVVKPTSFMRKAAAGLGNLTYDQYSQIRYEVVFYERIV